MNKIDLETTSATPLYRQIADKLESEITRGIYPPGSKIPTEFELAESLGVSRVTVRKALAELTGKGLITRRSGKGSFASGKKLQHGVQGSVVSFSDMCRMAGMEPGARTVRIAREEPSPEEARLLGLKAGEGMIVTERVRTADGTPVLLERNRYGELFSFLLGEDLNDRSLYRLLHSRGIVPHHASKTVDLVFAGNAEARKLGIAVGYPLLRIEELVRGEGDSFTMLSTQLCVGDRFRLRF